MLISSLREGLFKSFSHAPPKGMNGPQLGRLALGEQQHLQIALPLPSLEELEAFPQRNL
jgi:hypothetical protein